MMERVRAVLVTADDTMLVIRRTRPGIPEYWVLPGGGVEPSDESREAALHREIHEEIAGKADIIRLLHTRESDDERQLFYLARNATRSFDDRTGAGDENSNSRSELGNQRFSSCCRGSDLRFRNGQVDGSRPLGAVSDRCCPLCWARMGHESLQCDACSGRAD